MLKIQKASAGSGKTYMLTYEYIKLLLGYTDEDGRKKLHTRVRETHRSILAITFTNKATEEMKQRIVKELAILADEGSESPYMDSLCECYECSATDIHKVAKRALWELLNDFSMFNISTIDSFFQVILRTFAREAEVIYNYDIELRDDYAVKVGINDMLSSLSRNKGVDNRQLIDWLNKYMRSKVDSNHSWDIFKETKSNAGMSLYSFAKNISTETFKKNREAIKNYLSTKDNINNFLKEINRLLEETVKRKPDIGSFFFSLLNKYGLDEAGLNSNGGLKSFDKIRNGQEPTTKFFEINEDCSKWFKKAAVRSEDLSYDFVSAVVGLVVQYREICYVETTYDAMIKNIYALGLLGDIDYHIENFRKENDLILLSDTNDLLKKIICEDDAPFIYERIGVALKYFLIDEFQDTSRLQWENMRALLAESLSHNYDNLIIGDEKQSIYRFRNADPSLLQTQVYKDFSRHVSADSVYGKCSINWRSKANIVKFNNTLFSILPTVIEQDFELPMGSVAETYSNVVQLIPNKNRESGGCVKIEVIEKDNTSFKEKVATKIPAIIEEYISKGYKQRDIVILLNAKADAEMIIKCILDYGGDNKEVMLNVVSDESLFLANAPSIKLIISILRHMDCTYVVKNADNKPENRIISNNLIPEMLRRYEQVICTGKSPSEALEFLFENNENGGLRDNLKNFETLSTSLVTIVESIIKEYITPDALKRENAYIQAFQDVVINYSARHTISITQFLKWWDSYSSNLSIASSSDIDAINIMTIHKSKGLEFPCVIIPYCNWDINKDGELLWVEPQQVEGINEQIVPPLVPITFKKELRESSFREVYNETSVKNIVDTLNKTYVAFTRASENLCIFVPQGCNNTDIGRAMLNSIVKANSDEIEVLKANLGDKCDESSKSEVLLPLKDYYVEEETMIIGELQESLRKETSKNSKIETFELEDYYPTDRVDNLNYDLPDILTGSQREKGNLYHTILGKIKREKDIDLVVRRAKARGLLPQDAEVEIVALLAEGLKNTEVRSWFANDNRVINERQLGNKKTILRPDRIIVTPKGETIIIDYKFGAPSKSYHSQVLNYMKMLKVAGFKNVIGKLWYPITGEIVTVE